MNELDDPCGSRCNLAKGVYMSHNIVTAFLLFGGSYLELFRSEGLSRGKAQLDQNIQEQTYEVVCHLNNSFF
jgi:hypothetical protein